MVKCMNPWDPQSKRQYQIDGVYCALNAGQAIGGQAHGICFPINLMVATRGGMDDMRTCFGIGENDDPQFTLSATHEHGVCYEMPIVFKEREGCDGGGKGIMVSNKCYTLSTFAEPKVCYCIEGNVVDRDSKKNGKGWCEDVSPTLNTQDKHAVCFQLCGDRDNPSVSTSDTAYCIPANPMSDRGQAICYEK